MEQDYRIRPPRRPSFARWLVELPMRVLFAAGLILIRVIIIVRRFIPASLLLLLCALVPLIGFSLNWVEGAGSWLMLAAALMLAFAAGSMRGK